MNGLFTNTVGVPGRQPDTSTPRDGQDHQVDVRFPGSSPQTPGTYRSDATDTVTGETGGRLERCTATGTCPKIFEINSANDYWTKVASALTTDTAGNDLKDAPGARSYLVASLPHMAASGLASCVYPRNPLLPSALLRAMLVALDDWGEVLQRRWDWPAGIRSSSFTVIEEIQTDPFGAYDGHLHFVNKITGPGLGQQ
jgi:hypothetical protein